MKKILLILLLGLLTTEFSGVWASPAKRIWNHNPFLLKRRPVPKKVRKARALAAIRKRASVKFALQGIWETNGSYKAMISQKTYRIGDTVGDYKIVDIFPDRVAFLDRQIKTKMMMRLKTYNE